MTTATIGDKVVVTTAHRGVFFGEIVERTGTTVTLAHGRNCLQWHKSVRGFIGLAAHGPKEGSRVGPACDQIELMDVTSISLCSNEAVAAWESAPWPG